MQARGQGLDKPPPGGFPLGMADPHRHEIRESRKSTLLGTFAGWFMLLWCATLRYEIEDRAGVSRPGVFSGPVIFALWHNRIFYVPYAWTQLVKPVRPGLVVLTSASHDGATLAHSMAVLGMDAVRGSTSRRAVAALVGMRRALAQGKDVCITPDGPRGPCYAFQAGSVKLAESSQVPVIPVHGEASNSVRLETWDHLVIPMPFSRVRVIFDDALAVPPGLSEDAFEAERARIESVMRAATHDSDISPDPRPQ